MKYVMQYNAFHNLESIGIEGKPEKLIQYAYKNGNRKLKSATYANGDTMKATYNSMGQMIDEKWYNATNALIAHYKYLYSAEGNVVQSLDIILNKVYDYIYEAGKRFLTT